MKISKRKIMVFLIIASMATPMFTITPKASTNDDGIDVNYMYGVIERLSEIVFDMPYGRCFGTPGEWRAREIIG